MGFEIFSQLNWLAVLVGGLAFFVLGALWYSKLLFVKPWIRLTGVNVNDPNAKKGVGQIMFGSLILMIVCSLGIAIFFAKMGLASDWMAGAKVGLVAGVCFSATSIGICYLYEKKPLGLHLINSGYNILGCVLAGIIIAIWPK